MNDNLIFKPSGARGAEADIPVKANINHVARGSTRGSTMFSYHLTQESGNWWISCIRLMWSGFAILAPSSNCQTTLLAQKKENKELNY